MKKTFSFGIAILLMFSLVLPSYGKTEIGEEVILGGMPFGVRYTTNTVTADSFCDVNGQNSPASNAGILKNDIICKVNNKEIKTATDVISAVEASNGNILTILFKRGEKEMTVDVTPIKSDLDGKYKIGIVIRDSSAGIGTVTYINPKTHEFGGLGHGICQSDTGELAPLEHGIVNEVKITGIVKGISGTPGELRGIFENNKIGAVTKNTLNGVFGFITDKAVTSGKVVTTCKCDEVKKGNASVYCSLGSDKIEEYSIKIEPGKKDEKCFAVEITDQRLIDKTGGIVQGMSGSPIVQNGKLIGAITHVLINDPTRGYGIYIENMLDAAY